MNLNECARKSGTDKGPDFHGYTNYYDYWFRRYINPTILEIGVLNGDSIEMYNTYFNGECDIYCIDIEDKKYIMDRSLWTDVKIIFKTIAVVFKNENG